MRTSWRIGLVLIMVVLVAIAVRVAGDMATNPILLLFTALVLGGGVLIGLRWRAKAKVVLERNQHAVVLLNGGQCAEALAIFEECEQRAGRMLQATLRNLIRMNRAVALTRLGRADEALALCLPLLKRGSYRSELSHLRGHLIAVTATAYLLRPEPDLAAAEQLLTQEGGQLSEPQQGLLLSPLAILHARRRAYGYVIELLEHRWERAEAQLPVSGLRRLRLIWALALDGLGDQEGSREQLRQAGPNIVQDAQHLLQHWPELRALLSV